MSPTESQNAGIVRRVLAAYGRIPLQTWLQDFSPDMIYEEPGFSGRVQDIGTLGQALARQFAAHPEIGFVIHSLTASGDTVIVEGILQLYEGGTLRTYHQALFYLLHDQKIRRLRVYTQATS
jgi:ketosteroid isomerase-like protein